MRFNGDPVIPGPNDVRDPNFLHAISVYPNPINSSSVLEYNLTEACIVSISVYNELGQLIKIVQEDSKQQPGIFKIPFHLEEFPTGRYFIEVKTSGDARAIQVAK
jgi:hypothetical protein